MTTTIDRDEVERVALAEIADDLGYSETALRLELGIEDERDRAAIVAVRQYLLEQEQQS